MALINCPECGKEISDQVSNCPNCGYPLKKNKSNNSKKVIVLVGVIVLIIFVSVMIFIANLFFNSNEKKAIRYFQEGQLEEFQSIKPKMKSEETDNFSKFLEKEVENIWNEYLEKEIDFQAATEQLEQLIKYSDVKHVTNYNDTIKKLKELDLSRTAYKEAAEAEGEKNFQSAYNNYAKVIKDDENYDEAQSKMNAMKEALVDEYKKSAEEFAKQGNYNKALGDINTALKFIPDNQDLKDIKAQYTAKKEEQDKEKERAEREAALLTEGKVIESKEIQATYLGAELTKSINPDDTSGYYMYYSPQNESQIFLDIKFRIKNISNDIKMLSPIISSVKATYNSEYNYDSFNCFYSNSSSIDNVYMWNALEALDETTFHFALLLPKEVRDTDYPIEVEFMLDGVKQLLEYR